MNNYVKLAQAFHEAYERLAPSFGYKTREASAKPWVQVPENDRHLMIAVVQEVVGPALKRAALESAIKVQEDALAHSGYVSQSKLDADHKRLAALDEKAEAMTDYEKLARQTLADATGFPVEPMRPEIISRVARVLEQTMLEAQKELLLKMQLCHIRLWVPTDVPQPEFQEIADGAVPMWLVAKELERLHARLAELNANKP